MAVLSPNVPAMYELHFAVPMAGAVLCTFNTRHDAPMVSALLKHSGAKVFLVESSLLHVGRAALKRLADSEPGAASIPVLVTISDDAGQDSGRAADYDYEGLIKSAPSAFDIRWPADELDPITLNYTSGTTSRPKGVVYNHRGAYLNTIGTVLAYDITPMPTYLWTVPMFHCNVPAMYELHFAVPMAGAVLCTFNTRHDAPMVSALLKHSGAKVFLVESSLLHVGRAALKRLADSEPGAASIPVLVTISDDAGQDSGRAADYDYEGLIKSAPSAFDIRWPADELDPITLNYTSGTTSRPKGVVYNHRGAYLNTIGTVLAYDITPMPTYLWTVPMFHCNGWHLPWGVAMQGGTNVCLRHFTAAVIFDSIARHGVTHMGGAPTVLNMILNAPTADRKPLPGTVRVMTGGAPPPPRVLAGMEELGFAVYHIYGLTETYGPATVCAWMPEWDALPAEERARLKARQGFQHVAMEEVDVKDPATMESVPRDGEAVGEVMFRGNTVMSGYYKDITATKESMAGGWLHTGDLAVRHPDGYIQLKDRAKDIIISGGENISSIEVESVIFSHPAVLEAAVVARPDDHWGETPCAFVKLKDGAIATEAEIIGFCRERLPHFMAPKTVVFEDLPKTSTGKTQKFVLREKARAMGSLTKIGNSSKL